MSVFRRLKRVGILGISASCSLFLLLGGCSSAETDATGSDDASAAVAADTEQADADGYTLPPRPELTAPPEPELTGDEQTDALTVSQYFLELYPYILKTGDLSYWEKHIDPSCNYCLEMEKNSRDSISTGEWIDGVMSIDDSAFEKLADGSGDYIVNYLVTRKNVISYSTDKSEEVPDKTYHVLIRLGLHDSVWKVTDFLLGTPESFAQMKEQARG